MRRTASLWVLVVMTVGVLAGCGGEESGPPDQAPSAAVTPLAPVDPGPRPGDSASSEASSGPDAAYCAAATQAGMAANVETLRVAIDKLLATLPDRAGDDVRGALELLRTFYAEAEDLASAGEAYADATPAEQARMDEYFDFQRATCD